MAQIIVDMVDYKLDISSAIDYPRFFPDQNHLVAESRFGFDALKRLRKTGYIIHLAGPYHNYFGGAHGIIVNPSDGKLYGAADRRRGGAPRGY